MYACRSRTTFSADRLRVHTARCCPQHKSEHLEKREQHETGRGRDEFYYFKVKVLLLWLSLTLLIVVFTAADSMLCFSGLFKLFPSNYM